MRGAEENEGGGAEDEVNSNHLLANEMRLILKRWLKD
jgi:hypothetical protein